MLRPINLVSEFTVLGVYPEAQEERRLLSNCFLMIALKKKKRDPEMPSLFIPLSIDLGAFMVM